jgi:3-phenylpropionate/trans-cinnamate dioxygenase alpha subunit
MKELMNLEQGLLSRRIFVDPEIYQEELKAIFGRCWLLLGHESQLPNRGDFFTSYMGEAPVLVTRDKTGRIGGFLNSCRHRGMRLCRADAGNANSFMCSFHGWVYRNDGALTGVPRKAEAYTDALNPSAWGLVPVAHLSTYKGLIFATWDSKAPSLSEYLGNMAAYLDIILDRREGGTEFIGGTQKWTIKCNWKFMSENHIGDSYHTPITHHSPMEVGFYSRPAERLNVKGHSLYAGNGHGFCFFETPLRTDLPILKEYVEARQAEAEFRLGPVRSTMWLVNGAVFPNFGFVVSGAFRTFRVWHPRGPNQVEVWSWCIVDKAASPEFKDFIRLETLRGQSGPASTFEQDDGENFKECHACSGAPVAVDYDFNYMLRLGGARIDPRFQGQLNDMPSETNQLGLFAHWAKLMEPTSETRRAMR